MKAKILYEKLEKDFIKLGLSDDWNLGEISEFVCDNFKRRSMGLICDFTEEIKEVYTAVFPSKLVMQKILDFNVKNAMLFVHHPMIWDIRKAPKVFQNMDKKQLQEFKKRKISVYNLHVPLDNYGEYSTSGNLAKKLNLEIIKSFVPYFGSLCGVIAKSKEKTIFEIKDKFEKILGHKAVLYNYGDKSIKNNKVAIIAGGGNDLEMLKEIMKEGINLFITGISVKNDHSKKAHEFAEKNKINVLGGTHYSTEKFACINICNYFKNFGLNASFIEDDPVFEDM